MIKDPRLTAAPLDYAPSDHAPEVGWMPPFPPDLWQWLVAFATLALVLQIVF